MVATSSVGTMRLASSKSKSGSRTARPVDHNFKLQPSASLAEDIRGKGKWNRIDVSSNAALSSTR